MAVILLHHLISYSWHITSLVSMVMVTELYKNKSCQAQHILFRAPLQVLPPGEFNGTILESLPVYIKVL